MSRNRESRFVAFLREARRRKVWVSAGAYAALSIGLIELVQAVSEALLFPAWTARLVTFLLILAFPIVIVLAWTFDLTASGLRRTEPAGDEAHGTAAAEAPHPAGASTTAAAPRTRHGGSGSPRARTTPLPPAPKRRARSSEPVADAAAAPPDPERVKKAALAHIRHELRTPINAILGYSEMLMEEQPAPEVGDDLQKINASGKRLLALVDAILDPAKLETESERDLESYGAQIRADLRTPINAVVGYAEMLIEAEREAGRADLVPDLERILGAAQGLLELSGDIVQVATTAPERGELPGRLADSSELARGVLAKIRPVESGSGPGGQGSLLVVDDNATNRDLLTRQLARHGYIVAQAADGQEAMGQLERQPFDLVLLDVIMPVMDGIETLRRIKSDDRLGDIPVIMLSSLDEVDSALRCIELGAEEYLTKPVQATLLQARIEANLEIRRLRSSEQALRDRQEESEAFVERLLLGAFPASIAERVRAGEREIVDTLPETTILYCDIDRMPFGSGALADYVTFLAAALARFEELAAGHGVEMVMHRRHGVLAVADTVTGGESPAGAQAVAALALAFASELAGRGEESLALMRGGIHTGPAVSGLIGGDRLRWEVWGDAVDTAEALAAQAEPGTILASPTAFALLRDRFSLDARAVTEVAGKGQMKTYTLAGPLEGALERGA